MSDCIYCGKDAGEYDEHEECVHQSMAMALMIEDDQACVYCGSPMSQHSYWSLTTCVVDGPRAMVSGGPS